MYLPGGKEKVPFFMRKLERRHRVRLFFAYCILHEKSMHWKAMMPREMGLVPCSHGTGPVRQPISIEHIRLRGQAACRRRFPAC